MKYAMLIGDGMADMLTTALVNSGRYIVLERESLDTVLTEQDLGASGRIRSDTAAAIGEIEGAELLIVAAVTEFDGNSGGTSGSIGGANDSVRIPIPIRSMMYSGSEAISPHTLSPIPALFAS